MNKTYVHGYDHRENVRLQDQASTLVELLHSDTFYPAGCRVLDAGCGVGAQTVTLAKNSPDALITSVDISEASVAEARRKIATAGFTHVQFEQADIFNLPYGPEAFDHIFVCFVLEHLSRPVEALLALKNNLRPGGTITVIEGDHGSAYFHPDSEAARQAIHCQVELQRRNRTAFSAILSSRPLETRDCIPDFCDECNLSGHLGAHDSATRMRAFPYYSFCLHFKVASSLR